MTPASVVKIKVGEKIRYDSEEIARSEELTQETDSPIDETKQE